MTRTQEQLTTIREKTRTKILDAATRVFTRRGFAAASMQDIATEAGISVGLIYRHFKTKEELFGTLMQQAAQGLKDVQLLFSQPIPPQQLIQGFTSQIIDDLKHNDDFPGFMILVTQAFMTEDFVPEVKELIKQNQMMIRKVAGVIKKGQGLGVFKVGDPTAMALYYFSSIQGLAETKFALKDKFVTPSPQIINAFLIKEKE